MAGEESVIKTELTERFQEANYHFSSSKVTKAFWELISEDDFTTEIKEPDKAKGWGVSFLRRTSWRTKIQAEKQQETRKMIIVKDDRVMGFGDVAENFTFICGL